MSCSTCFGSYLDLRISYSMHHYSFFVSEDKNPLPDFVIPSAFRNINFARFNASSGSNGLSLDFAGVVRAGYEHSVDVGDQIHLSCPQNHVFDDSWYSDPVIRMTCDRTGQMHGAPERFPKCIKRELYAYRVGPKMLSHPRIETVFRCTYLCIVNFG